MPRADFLTGLVLLGVAGALLAEGWRLPGAAGLIEAGGEPGRVLIFLGLVIAALAAVLTLRSIAHNGHRMSRREPLDPTVWNGALRGVATALGGTLYVALLGSKPFGIELGYTLLTFGFMFLFIVIAEWKLAPEIAARRWQALQARAPGLAALIAPGVSFVPARRAPFVWLAFTAAVQAALIALSVAYVFEKQFFVTLP